MLPYHHDSQKETDEELSDGSKGSDPWSKLSDSEKLHIAFQNVRLVSPFHH